VTLLGKDAIIQYTKALTSDLDGAFNVRADNVRISGFTINSAYGTGVGGILSGIEIGMFTGPFTSGCQIDNNIINSPDWGVSGYAQTGVIVKNNVISAHNPVFLTNAIDITVKGNYITAKTYPSSPINPVVTGIMLPGCNGALIKNNQINSENYGILINQSPQNIPTNVEIKGNQILTSNDGIYSDKGINFVVKNNDITATRYGIWLNDMQGTQATVAHNTITSGSTAIYVGNAA
jgi:nitrous oxidase accessory protein NosD